MLGSEDKLGCATRLPKDEKNAPSLDVQGSLEDLVAGVDNLPSNGLISSRNVSKVDAGEPCWNTSQTSSSHIISCQAGWVTPSTSTIWAPSNFDTYSWADREVGFHPHAIYWSGEYQFCAKFNRGTCTSAPFCFRWYLNHGVNNFTSIMLNWNSQDH